MTLIVLALGGTLKARSAGYPSPAQRMLQLPAAAMERYGVPTDVIRYDIKPGVTSNEGARLRKTQPYPGEGD